jgi:hypothetical protein
MSPIQYLLQETWLILGLPGLGNTPCITKGFGAGGELNSLEGYLKRYILSIHPRSGIRQGSCAEVCKELVLGVWGKLVLSIVTPYPRRAYALSKEAQIYLWVYPDSGDQLLREEISNGLLFSKLG